MDIESILRKLNIQYVNNGTHLLFNYLEVSMSISIDTTNVYISPDFFGEVPHVMQSGAICISGTKEIRFHEDEELALEKTITTYVPWLLAMSDGDKTIEFFNEIDFYLLVLFESRGKKVLKRPENFIERTIASPRNLWETISLIEENNWYKLTVLNYSSRSIWIKKSDDIFLIFQDEEAKSRMRVVANNYNQHENMNALFIGMGSVNSYILKMLASKGLKKITMVDNDIVETGNLFRYAFPYIGVPKVDAAESFVNAVNSDAVIIKINSWIDSKSKGDCLTNRSHIFVSVDNYLSWINIILFLYHNVKEPTTIVFSGIDVFGRFGKYICLKYDPGATEDKISLLSFVENFLEVIPECFTERKIMVGNGCGKSLAVYSETDLLKIANEVISMGFYGKTQVIKFENSYYE